jgi:hypothetical protein
MVRPVMQAMTSLKPKEKQANVNAGTIAVVGSSFNLSNFRCGLKQIRGNYTN